MCLGFEAPRSALVMWFQYILDNGVSDALSEWWSHCSLLALHKEGGGIRPIAVGEVIPRLLGRVCHAYFGREMQEELRPSRQYGVATPHGAEIVYHTIRSALDLHRDWAVMRIDVANAFNTVDRVAMFDALKASSFDGLIPFLRTLYETASPLIYRGDGGNATFTSRTGVRQGDPLSPFLYAYTQRVALQAVAESHPGCLMLSYADDTFVVGASSAMPAILASLMTELRRLSLHVQPHKCSVWSPTQIAEEVVQQLYEVTCVAPSEGVTVLGAPLGTEAYQVQELHATLSRKAQALSLLPRLHHPQAASKILSMCISQIPSYYIRLLPPSCDILRVLKEWDSQLVTAFDAILGSGTYLSTSRDRTARCARQQLSLPIRIGGFGLRYSAKLAHLSYACSWLSCIQPMFQDMRVEGASLFPRELFLGDAPMLGGAAVRAATHLPVPVQHDLPSISSALQSQPRGCFARAVELLEDSWLARIRNHLGGIRPHLARLTSLQGKHAGAWVQALPTSRFLVMEEPVWRTAVRMRLGLPIPHLQAARTCPDCRLHYDFWRDPTLVGHALRCSQYRGPGIAHDAVRNVVYSIAAEARLQPILEDSALLSPLRVDVNCYDAANAQYWALDVVVVDPQQPRYSGPRQLEHPGVAAAGAEQVKITHYATALSRHDNVVLRPLALETMGAMGERFQDFLRDCANNRRHYMRVSEDDMTRIIQAMAQRISIALMTAQVHVIHGRARRQQPVLNVPFRTTIHTASDLCYIGRD